MQSIEFFNQNKILQYIKEKRYLSIIFMLIVLGIYYLIPILTKDIWNHFWNKEEISFNIKLKDKTDTRNYNFKLNYKNCTLKESDKKGTLLYSCDKLKAQEYPYSFGEYKNKITLVDSTNMYDIEIDNYDYMIESHELFLEKNKLKGSLSIKDKRDGIFKYANKETNIPIKLHDIEINEYEIENGYLNFQKNWNEISNIYYSYKKLYTEYSIANNIYKSSKYYLLSNNLNINKIFSISPNTDQLFDINTYLKINNNNLIIYGNQNIPNINLITVKAREENDLNGFIKFNLINVNKDAKINLFLGKNYLFSISSLNYHFPINLEDGLSRSNKIDPMHQTDKNIKLKNKNLIEKIEITILKKKNDCQIIVKTNNHRPATHNTICTTKEFNFEENINNLQVMNFQLNIESPTTCKKNNNCILFEIENIITGI